MLIHAHTLKIVLFACFAGICGPFAAQAAHPLNTEDTGTQGTGNFQLEFNFEHGHEDFGDTHANATVKSAALSYGAGEDIDIIFTLPHTDATTQEEALHIHSRGFGDRALDIKWRFYENDGFSLALKPGLTFPTGDYHQGLGQGKTTYTLVFINSIESNPWQINWHIGYRRNHNTENEREHLWHYSISGLRQISERVRLVGDVGTDTDPDKSRAHDTHFLVLGGIYSPTDKLDIDAGIKKEFNGSSINHVFMAGLTIRW